MLIFISRTMASSGFTHEHISHLYWRNTGTGAEGNSSVEDIIKWLDNGNRAYVQGGGETIDVLVRRPAGRRAYLETRPDRTRRDNLLALPLTS